MTYREMETTPPARQWGWAVRRALLWTVRVVCLTAGVAMGAKGCSAFAAWTAEAEINANRRAYEERQRTIGRCIGSGGSWSEGTIDGKHAEWCAGVRR